MFSGSNAGVTDSGGATGAGAWSCAVAVPANASATMTNNDFKRITPSPESLVNRS